jgi:magnesium transporter
MKSDKRGKTGKRRFYKRLKLFERSREAKLGLPPGTPVHVGARHAFKPYCTLFQYDSASVREFNEISPKELAKELKTEGVNWINVEGVHDVKFAADVAKVLDLHPLTQEDIVNTSLRPQFDSIADYYFFGLQMLYSSDDGLQLTSEHISLVLKGNTVLTFQETPGDVFGKIRERIRAHSGPVCSRGADYLLYLLLDSIVDGYYQVIDRLGERIDDLEESMQLGPRDELLSQTFGLRREILLLRKNIVPVRDVLNKVQVAGTVFQENTKIFVKDLTDHILQVTDALNLSMDMSNVLIDTYHSMQNQRLNAVMKTLTMISTIFLPLNFIAGVYGMNFEHMPETKWVYGYPMAVGAMLLVGCLMLAYFVHKGWLWESRLSRLPVFALFAPDDPLHDRRQETGKASSEV